MTDAAAEPSQAATDAPAPAEGSAPENASDKGGKQGGKKGARRRSSKGSKGANKRGPRRRRAPRSVDTAPPRFDPSLLAELSGPPLWQAVHEAEVKEVTDAAVFVEVKPKGHEALRAMVDPKELVGQELSVGQVVRVRLLDPPRRSSLTSEDGAEASPPVPVASIAQARALDGLDTVLKSKDGDEPAPGLIVAEVKGGYTVALGVEDEAALEKGAPALRAFLPKSQGEHPRLHEAKTPVGEADRFDLTEIEPERANIVLSRKKALKERYDAQVAHVWASLREGEKVKGRVRALAPFGAFVDLGGIDALLHQSDLSWDRSPKVSSVVKVGDEIEAQVILVDQDKGKIKVGLKQLIPNPWEDVKKELKEGSDIEGDVVALTDYGAFVRIAEGVEGLVHLSEVTWDRIKHVSQRLNIGDRITARVLDVDLANRRISLSTKALEPNPFQKVADAFPPGTVVRAKVKSLTDFGAFVSLDENVDGLIHIGELSWTEHVTHPSQVVTLGEEVEVVVLDVDVARQRVACSIKQLTQNPWKVWEDKYRKGSRHTLTVNRVAEQGAYFDVDEGLAGFCHNRDLSSEPVSRAADAVRVGDEMELEVKALDKRRRQVVLSAKAVIEGDTRAAYDEYKRRETEEGGGRLTLGDALKGQLPGTTLPDAPQPGAEGDPDGTLGDEGGGETLAGEAEAKPGEER